MCKRQRYLGKGELRDHCRTEHAMTAGSFAASGTASGLQLPVVRPATALDAPYVLEAFDHALGPFYGGDHIAHARRLVKTHLEGGDDQRGLLSARQLLLILWDGRRRAGVLNLVFKRQATCKISPLILYPRDQRDRGLRAILVSAAEQEARKAGARQLYCTVARSNAGTLQFFVQNGFVLCGQAYGQYKEGETEVLLRRAVRTDTGATAAEDLISVVEVTDDESWIAARKLLVEAANSAVEGVDDSWIDSLRLGTSRLCGLPGPEQHGAWAYAAVDRSGEHRAAAIVVAKKGGALKIMPLAARDDDALRALLVDLPMLLADKGRKAYVHMSPAVSEISVLQETGWLLEAQIPGAYHSSVVTQQWGHPLSEDAMQKTLRIQPRYLSLIASGQKTLEIRVGYDHIREIKPGASIRLTSNDTGITRKVKSVRKYTSFTDMIAGEDLSLALPGLDPASALSVLRNIYPPEKESLGVFVFELARP